MPDFLLACLAAPMAAFGLPASGGWRPSAARPTRSASLGLLAAALGLRRHEDEALRALHEGYGFAVEAVDGGESLLDYHTVQAPHQVRLNEFARSQGRPPLTRAEALAFADPETILSSREYRAGVRHHLAFWARQDAPYPLADLRAALRRPRLAPYAGRRSCPLALPLMPEVIAAGDLFAAFAEYDAMVAARLSALALPDGTGAKGSPRPVAGDLDAPLGLGSDGGHRHIVRDHPLSRSHWLFAEREEWETVRRPA